MSQAKGKEEPILFRERHIPFIGPMIRAERAGLKDVTRRVAKMYFGRVRLGGRSWHVGDPDAHLACPYGQPGDRLWVRETWAAGACADGFSPSELHRPTWTRDNGGLWYAADNAVPSSPISPRGKWRPSIFMPRWASRTTLEVVSVRLEPLLNITEEDARREGVSPIGAVGCECETEVEEPAPHLAACGWSHIDIDPIDTPHLAAFAVLWDQLNAGRGYGWDFSPRVWRIEFRRVA